MRRSARSINVCERTDGLWGLPPELMCRVQRGKTWYSGSVGVYCRRTRVKMEILGSTTTGKSSAIHHAGGNLLVNSKGDKMFRQRGYSDEQRLARTWCGGFIILP